MPKVICLPLNQADNGNFESEINSSLLFPIKKFNVFIGTNNSGKSTFLRNLFIQYVLEQKFLSDENLSTKIDKINKFFKGSLIANIGPIVSKEDQDLLSNDILNIQDVFKYYEILSKYRNMEYLHLFSRDSYPKKTIPEKTLFFNNYLNVFDAQIKGQFSEDKRLKSFYFPVIRTIRPIDSYHDETSGKSNFTNKDLIKDRTIFEYFLKYSDKLKNNIFSGITFFDDIHKLICGNEAERNSILEFELFLSENIFNGKKTILIPKYESKFVEIKLGDEQQLPIYKIGDGVQSIIILLFYVFINKDKPCFYFIEEPETHLHPLFQKKLIEALYHQEFKQNTYFISTHSNLFINNIKTSVFKFERKSNISYFKHLGSLEERGELLKELGYKNSDLFLSNYILWVEGPSDRLYIEKLITQSDPNLRIGENYQILLLNGENGVHLLKDSTKYSFEVLDSINRNFGFIIDSDKKSDDQIVAKWKSEILTLSMAQSKFCLITSAREIENHIDFEDYVQAAKIAHQNSELIFENGKFSDRNKFNDPKSSLSFKRSFKFSEELHKRISDSNGNIKAIPASVFKSEFKAFISSNSLNNGNVSKMKMAQLLSKSFLKVDNELDEGIRTLISYIKKA